MNRVNLNKFDNNIIIYFIFLIGAILRIANLGNHDLWFDEIITFSLGSPEISLKEFFYLSNSLDSTPILFNFFLRSVFNILPYDVLYIKIFLVIFSIASIISVSYLAFILTKKKSILLVVFFLSFNVFLIDYCSELRIYNFIFFTSSLSIIYFFKFYNNNNNLNFILFFLITILNSFLHPFTLIILFSYIFFLFLQIFKKKILQTKIITCLILIVILSFVYYYLYFLFLESIKLNLWIPSVNLKFFYNYFFSNFFGSKILGIFFLSTLIFLFYKNFVLLKKDSYLFLTILLLFSYIIPLVYSYFVRPILIPRYIIFVLIPIILLISIYLSNLKNIFLKKNLTIIVIFLVLINSILELPIKKIYNPNYGKKPEFTRIIKLISSSGYKNYIILFSDNNLDEKKFDILRIYQIYLNSLSKKNNFLTEYEEEELDKSKISKLWVICDYAINSNDCSLDRQIQYNTLKNFNFYKINLKLIEIF